MPYIKIKPARELTHEKQEELVKSLGEAISKIPGKDGRMLITDLEDGITFSWRRRQDDFAYIDAPVLFQICVPYKKRLYEGRF
jgi:hypothetical protein